MVCFNLKWFVVWAWACECECVSCRAPHQFFPLHFRLFLFSVYCSCVPMSWRRLQAPQWRKSNTKQKSQHNNCVPGRIQSHRFICFPFGTVRILLDVLLHLLRCEQIYWQYRFSEFLIIAICRFFRRIRHFFALDGLWSEAGGARFCFFSIYSLINHSMCSDIFLMRILFEFLVYFISVRMNARNSWFAQIRMVISLILYSFGHFINKKNELKRNTISN